MSIAHSAETQPALDGLLPLPGIPLHGSFTPGPAACVFFITTARFTHHRRISAIAP
jgi:hypothetical protein